jgi:hypothetical protein
MTWSGQRPLEHDWTGIRDIQFGDEPAERREAPHRPPGLLHRRVDGDAAFQAECLRVVPSWNKPSGEAGGEVIERGRVTLHDTVEERDGSTSISTGSKRRSGCVP